MVWTPFGDEIGPQSQGRTILSEFLTWFLDQMGLVDPTEIGVHFETQAPAAEWSAVTSTVEFLGEKIQSGQIRSYARLLGGGPVEPIPAAKWEMDSFLERFRTSAFDPARWTDPTAPPTHYIFLSNDELGRFWEEWSATPEPKVETTPEEADLAVLRLPEVVALTSLSRSTIYSKIARGQFPRPVKLSERASAWRKAEVQAWLEKL